MGEVPGDPDQGLIWAFSCLAPGCEQSVALGGFGARRKKLKRMKTTTFEHKKNYLYFILFIFIAQHICPNFSQLKGLYWGWDSPGYFASASGFDCCCFSPRNCRKLQIGRGQDWPRACVADCRGLAPSTLAGLMTALGRGAARSCGLSGGHWEGVTRC